jgi:hypothetical protein
MLPHFDGKTRPSLSLANRVVDSANASDGAVRSLAAAMRGRGALVGFPARLTGEAANPGEYTFNEQALNGGVWQAVGGGRGTDAADIVRELCGRRWCFDAGGENVVWVWSSCDDDGTVSYWFDGGNSAAPGSPFNAVNLEVTINSIGVGFYVLDEREHVNQYAGGALAVSAIDDDDAGGWDYHTPQMDFEPLPGIWLPHTHTAPVTILSVPRFDSEGGPSGATEVIRDTNGKFALTVAGTVDEHPFGVRVFLWWSGSPRSVEYNGD